MHGHIHKLQVLRNLGDLSCDAVSLIVESQGDCYSPNKGIAQNNIETSSSDDITDHDITNIQQSTVTDQGQEDGIKVTKVTGSKLQGMKITEVVRSKMIIKKTSKQHAGSKNKVTINTSRGTSTISDMSVAMECDTEMVTTSTPSEVSKVTKQHNLSLSTWPVDALNDGASLLLPPMTNISKAGKLSSKADRSSSKADRPSSKADKLSSKTDRSSSKANKLSSRTDRPLSKADKLPSKTDIPSSKVDKPSSQDKTMNSDHSNKRIISVIVNNNSSHDRKSRSHDHSMESSSDRKSRSPDHSVVAKLVVVVIVTSYYIIVM